MKTRDKIFISIVIGLIAMTFYSFPMWWGVLFSPLVHELTGAPLIPNLTGGVCWELDGVILRFRSLDLLLSWIRGL